MTCVRTVFWQKTPSPHQAPWIRALAEMVPNMDIVGVFQESGLSQERIALGWQPPNYGNARILISPDKVMADQLIQQNAGQTLHIFSGMLENSAISGYFHSALASEARVGVLSEGRDWRGWKGLLRLSYKAPQEHGFSKSVDFVLAMGQVGMQWFARCGIDKHKLFQFCYVVETSDNKNMHNDEPGTSVQITAVGQLIKRKRFDLILMALKRVTSRKWKLKIVGDGELRESLEKMTADFDLCDRVEFTGVLNNVQVRHELAQTDIFLLASHWDGWGAVVNEALMSGVPVVCSDYCGAAVLLRPDLTGDVFESDNVDSLAKKLSIFIERGPLHLDKRNQIRDWSHCIEGPSVARYFLDILGFINGNVNNRPDPPWCA